RRQPVRIEPEAHAVVAGAENLDVADALAAQQLILELDRGEVTEVKTVKAPVRRDKVDAEKDIRRGLLGAHALELHLRRQLRQGQSDAILHEYLGDVEVGADLKSDGKGV